MDPLVIYKIIDPHNYLLMTLDGKILKGLFEYKRLNPTIIITKPIEIPIHLIPRIYQSK